MSDVIAVGHDLPAEWRSIPGFPDYEVSATGLVRSWKNRFSHKRADQPRLLATHVKSNGYLAVSLCRNGRTSALVIHKLVLWAFVGPRPPGQEARHLDGDRLNPALSNLCWGTKLENWSDRIRHGRHMDGNKHWSRRLPNRIAKGERHGMAKLSAADARDIYLCDDAPEDLAIRHDVHVATILNVRRGKTWQHVTCGLRRAAQKPTAIPRVLQMTWSLMPPSELSASAGYSIEMLVERLSLLQRAAGVPMMFAGVGHG